MAGGRFAPGHVGELTRIVPFEMVDAALAETRTRQRRVRDLPSRVVVYLLLAGALFADLGYLQVWARMTAGLDGLAVAVPTAGGLAQARRRVGIAPLRALFDLLRGPAAGLSVKGVHWRGRLVTAIDGTMWVPTTRSPHATCTYSWTRPPSRSRRSGRTVAPERGGVPPAGGVDRVIGEVGAC